jgi:hypothetical protein
VLIVFSLVLIPAVPMYTIVYSFVMGLCGSTVTKVALGFCVRLINPHHRKQPCYMLQGLLHTEASPMIP